MTDIQGLRPAFGVVSDAGFAFTANADAYMTVGAGTPTVWTLYALDKVAKQWRPLQTQSSYVRLYGADTNTLVSSTADRFTLRFLNIAKNPGN